MLDIFDRLFFEIIKVQMMNSIKKEHIIYLDSYFMREDTEIIENLLEGYDTLQTEEKDDNKKEEALNLDDVLELLVADLDIFSLLYQLPKITIKNDEWDMFFQTLFWYYQQLNIEHFFLEDMESLNRYAMAKAMIDQEEVNLSTYIGSLKYVDSDVLYPTNLKAIESILQKEFPGCLLNARKSWNYKKSRKNFEKLMEDIYHSDIIGEEVVKQRLKAFGYQVEGTKRPPTYEKNALIYQLDPKARSFIKKSKI